MGQAGSAAKSFLLLSVIMAGVIAAYLHYSDAKSRIEADGGGAVKPMGDMLMGQLNNLPSQHRATYSVDEQIESTQVTAEISANECDMMFLNQVYQTCAMHRVQYFKDSACSVVLMHAAGECSQP